MIPAAIRKQLNIHAGDVFTWINEVSTLQAVPVPADALGALYGRGKGEGLNAKLAAERAQERVRDKQGNRARA